MVSLSQALDCLDVDNLQSKTEPDSHMRVRYGLCVGVLILSSNTFCIPADSEQPEPAKIIDSNGDGWDDLWVEIFKTMQVAETDPPDLLPPLGDFDGDGVSNHDEMLAFSDPYSPPSASVTGEELEAQRNRAKLIAAARQARLQQSLAPSLIRALDAIPDFPDGIKSATAWENRRSEILRSSSRPDLAEEAHARGISERAKLLGIPKDEDTPTGGSRTFQGFSRRGLATFLQTINVDAGAQINAPSLTDPVPSGYGVTGAGGTIGMWEPSGIPLWEHPEFLTEQISAPNPVAQERVAYDPFEFGPTIEIRGHATCVAGTMISAGYFQAGSRGIQPEGRVFARETTFDTEEMMESVLEIGQATLLMSNHSYKTSNGWEQIDPEDRDNDGNIESWRWHGDPIIGSGTEDHRFGFYTKRAQQIDELTYVGRRFLSVWGTGNDIGDGGPSAGEQYQLIVDYDSPLGQLDNSVAAREDDGGSSGFDTIGPEASAKNILSVGGVDEGGVIAPFSCRGPTDDGRIKPDLVANGTTLNTPSSFDVHPGYNVETAWDGDINDALEQVPYSIYATASGTSFAAPAVSAALNLVQELFLRETGAYVPQFPGEAWPTKYAMRSDALKAFAIHTAADLGNPGPDYTYGWGLFDAGATADLVVANINSSGSVCHNRNILVQQGTPVVFDVEWDATEPLKITLCWHDPAFQTNNISTYYDPTVYDPDGIPAVADRLLSDVLPDTLDPTTPMLVNDLDLRVTAPDGTTVFLPWVLNPSSPTTAATTGDNVLDNVEQILLDPAEMSPAPQSGIYTVSISHKGNLKAAEAIDSGDPDYHTVDPTDPEYDLETYKVGYDQYQFRHINGSQFAAVVISGNEPTTCPTLQIKTISIIQDGQDQFAVVTWDGIVGHGYVVEYSEDLIDWFPETNTGEEIYPFENGELSFPVYVPTGINELFVRVRSI